MWRQPHKENFVIFSCQGICSVSHDRQQLIVTIDPDPVCTSESEPGTDETTRHRYIR